MTNNNFVQLHTHTDNGSLLDSMVDVENMVKKAKDMGMPAVAMTDHGTVHNIVNFYKACEKHSIKPIYGVEMYITNKSMHERDKEEKRHHILLLAKNEKGLKNIFKLITIANKEGFYYKPRIDFPLLKQYSEGIIVSSACLGGEIPSLLLEDKYQKAKNAVNRYKDVFGDDFYLEMMSNKLEEQYKANKLLVELAKDTNTKLVGTNDIHYLNKEDYKAHDVLLAIQTKSTIYDDERFTFEANEFYFKNEKEMVADMFKSDKYNDIAKKSLKNTLEVARKIEKIDLELGNIMFPDYKVPKNYTEDTFLEYVTNQKLREMTKSKDIDYIKYKKRLNHELNIIANKGYSSYFFIVADFVRYAKNNNIMVGVGRGSAGGSLVSYLMGIIAIDPIEHGLLFSRFLNPERDSMPDIDMDFSREGRKRVIEYVKDKYGEEHVAQLATFGTMSTKAVLKDVGRALDYNFGFLNNKVVPQIPDSADNIGQAIKESDKLQEYAQDNVDLFKYASQLEDKPRHLGTHAAAVVISPKPVTDVIPLAKSKNDLVTQVEMHDAEELGLLKVDFLGLKTLDLIGNTIEFIQQRDDLDKFSFVPTKDNIAELPLDDDRIYKEIYQKADTNGVFQVESYLFKKIMKNMKPTKFEHIVALVALGRPGTLEAGIVDDYIDRMHGKQEIDYPHPDLEEVLKETFGFMIYQEQVMKTAQIIGGFSLGKADILRRGMGKKKKEVIEELKVDFMKGAKEQGYSKELAEEIFDLIEYFSGYGFNKSHSVAYGLTSYITAYLKHYFPKEFYASLMTLEASKTPKESKLDSYITDCLHMEIPVNTPDVNKSLAGFNVVDNKIIFGLGSIKGIGEKALADLLEKRPFKSLDDLYHRVRRRVVNKTVVEALIKSGALDSFSKNREGLLDNYYLLRKANVELKRELSNEKKEEYENNLKGNTDENIMTKMEIETLGMSVTYPSKWDMLEKGRQIKIVGNIEDLSEVKTKNNNDMAFAQLKNSRHDIKLVIFPYKYEKCKNNLADGNKKLVRGEKGDNGSMILKSIEDYKK